MKNEIENKGYWIGEIESKEMFLQIGQELGELSISRSDGNILDELIPKIKTETKRNSLSKMFGFNDFPYHTDCAYQKNPPRYIALRYVGNEASKTPTKMKCFNYNLLNEEEKYFVTNKMWFVTNGIGSFYSTICAKIGNNEFQVRYDPVCMRLVDNHKKLKEKWNVILDKFREEEVYWTKNKTLILDNWKMLHARGSVLLKEKATRKIQRLNIK